MYRLQKLVNLEQWDKNKEYECDIFIRNAVWGELPTNIHAERSIEMRHADYKYLESIGQLKYQYRSIGIKEIVACGDYVGKMSDEVLHDNPTVIKNILAPKKKTNRIIKLISCTRLDADKGWNRMKKMMQMMRDADIKFRWEIFTNAPQPCEYEEVKFYKPRFDIWDYLADADYTVLLSKSEGLPYTVQESLQYEVPCIVTDIPGCTELVKDGVNGYVVPIDMNFDINKIKNIPKCKPYDNGALEKWLEYLGDPVYIEPEDNNVLIELELLINITYSKYDTIVKLKPLKKVTEGQLFKGDRIIIDDEKEAERLCAIGPMGVPACQMIKITREK